MKKRKIVLTVICGILLCAATVLVYSARVVRFDSQQEFAAHGGRMPFEIPETAADCCFALRKGLFSKLYLCAFRLDETACRDYLDALCAAYKLDSEDADDRAYSYAHWYQQTVSDCVTGDVMCDFPVDLPFSAVTEREIGEAEIIVYYPKETGGRSFGAVYFPETGEFVCYEHLSR